MSHYTVGVILKKEDVQNKIKNIIDDVVAETGTGISDEERKFIEFTTIRYFTDKAMSPFYENAQIPCPELSIEEIEKEYNSIKNFTEEEREQDKEKAILYREYADKPLDYYVHDYYSCAIEEGELYSLFNPQAKWDWYVIGGRWAGSLMRKVKLTYSEEPDSYEDDINSYAQIKDLRFRKLITPEQHKQIEETYNKFIEKGDGFFNAEYYTRRYPTFDKFLKEQLTFSTYSLLTSDGEWHEPGEMGWFGISTAAPEEERDFSDVFAELIKKEDEENYFVLVDCHI